MGWGGAEMIARGAEIEKVEVVADFVDPETRKRLWRAHATVAAVGRTPADALERVLAAVHEGPVEVSA